MRTQSQYQQHRRRWHSILWWCQVQQLGETLDRCPYSRKRKRRTCSEVVRSLQGCLWEGRIEAVTNPTETKSQIQVSGKSVRGFGIFLSSEWGAESLWPTWSSAGKRTMPQKTADEATGEISSSFTWNLTQIVNGLWHITRVDRVSVSVRIWHSVCVSLGNIALGRQSQMSLAWGLVWQI